MVRVIKTRNWEFEIPKKCGECPLMDSINDGNATIYLCKIMNNPKWNEDTVDPRTKSKKCPLVDGQSYTI